jgi:non-specific serine/threonine protein kinase
MPGTSTTSFAALLRRYRLAAGLTQEELAERANLSVRAVSDLERGVRRIPYRETVETLAAALGLSAEQGAALAASVPRGKGPTTAGRRAGNLPVEITPLVGREREEAEAVHMLRWGGTRLLTLTGPGGVGKTRLAIRIAADLVDDFAGGVFFVSLAPLREHGLVPSAIAQVLGIGETAAQPVFERLRAFLHEKELLLVLDNFEQVVQAGETVGALVVACPSLVVLVTSRMPLHVRAEQQMDVPPLALPDPAGLMSTDRSLTPINQLRRYPAAALFIQRAHAVRPELEIGRIAMVTIAQICRRLEGLPLAIELAATRMKFITPEALLSFLDDRLATLAGGPWDLPPRQQAMRDTIAWSYDLLESDEQRLFREVAVFAGSFALEAALTICTVPDEEQLSGRQIRRLEALDRLSSLADKSLLAAVEEPAEPPNPTFAMLETIREYGLERLEAEGEAEEIHGRHAGYILDLAERAEAKLHGSEQARWLEILEQDHDNLRTALRWLLDRASRADESGTSMIAPAEQALRLTSSAARFWWMRGHLTEGRRWLHEALALDGGASVLRAKALRGAGLLALAQADYPRATAALEESLTISRQLGDTDGVARALNYLAIKAHEEGDYARAVALHEETLTLRRELDDTLGLASSLNNLGIVLRMQGQYQRAWELFEESLALGRQLGDTRGAASTLHNLGETARHLGRLEEASATLEEGLALYQEVGDRRGIAKSLGALALVALRQGDNNRCLDLAAEAVRLAFQVGDRASVIEPLKTVAEAVALGQKAPRDAERALQLFAAAEAIRAAAGAGLEPGESARNEAFLSELRSRLDAATWDGAWQEGQAMPVEGAVDLAIELAAGSESQ